MNITENIIEHLSDNSFPIVHMIDGKWGSGKTHFVKNNLIAALNNTFNQHTFYLSLYGVQSLDDFKDKLISIYSFNNKNFSKLVKNSSSIIDGVAQISGKRGAGAVLSGVSSLIKQTIYSNINDCIFILDDLERCTKDMADNILAESLYFAENKNIKIIIIANSDKLTCKDSIEKTIASKTVFSYNENEILTIIISQFGSMIPSHLTPFISKTLAEINCTNLRTIRRAIHKYIRLAKDINQLTNIDYDESLKLIFEQILKCCHAIYDKNFTSSFISETISSRLVRQISNDKDLVDDSLLEYHKDIDFIFSNLYRVNEKLIKWCETGEYEFLDFIEELSLPIKNSNTDLFINKRRMIALNETEFDEAKTDFIKFILDPKNASLYKWFSCCDIALHYLELGYIDSNSITKELILDKANEIDIQCFDENLIDNDEYHLNFFNPELKEIYFSKRSIFSNKINKDTESTFISNFIKSWLDVEEYCYDTFKHSPFLDKMNINQVKDALDTWNAAEVFNFAAFMKSRYNFRNIDEFFKPEFDILREIETSLHTINCNNSIRKIGALKDLFIIIAEINKRMSDLLSPSV